MEGYLRKKNAITENDLVPGVPVPGLDRTGPRDLEGPVVLARQDLETLKVPGLFLKVPAPFSPLNITRICTFLSILNCHKSPLSMKTLLFSQFDGPRDGRDKTGQDLETLKVPWSWQDRT